MRFKLEDGRGFSAGKKFVGRLIIERQRSQIHVDAAILLHHAHGIIEHGERRQTQKIHFQQADMLEALHVVLRRDFIPVGLVQRDDIRERFGRNHDACRVRRGVAREAFQALGDFHHVDVARVAIDLGS